MWLLPTRGRAKLCQEFLDACVKTGMSTPGIIVIDNRIDSYPDLKVPPNWAATRLPLDMGDCCRLVFDLFPKAKFYGWVADDLLPVSPEWDIKLIEAAGDWYVSDCNDVGYICEIDTRVENSLCGAFCYGGEFFRALGWWVPPGLRQAGIDDVHTHICVRTLPLRHHLHDVYVEHRNYRTLKRVKDETDEHVRDGVGYVEIDVENAKKFMGSKECEEAIQRLRDGLNKAGIVL